MDDARPAGGNGIASVGDVQEWYDRMSVLAQSDL
jgi:hypothetical protein